MTTEERITNSRAAKAEKLAALLRKSGFTVPQVKALSEQHWKELAILAGTRPPSAETVRVVIGLMSDGKR